MALGFGFNKAKVLSTAEKFVQQGKLQNAIAEYEKVSKQDAKDLTVLNTIGDLYARLGRPDKATEYFKKVGDAYASDGFVVKAIAMYKKLTKLNPSATDSVVRLAELYTQQGLYNDARSQYMAVADQYLKANDRENATAILKKMLDLDPDNAAMQTKVADLYLKLGKNKEALEIYFASAQSLYQRGTLDAAEAALAHVLKIDAKYEPALLLRGQIAGDSGNSSLAIENLAKLPDLDSRPDALRSLLQAYLKNSSLEQAEPLATTLADLHNDLSGITAYTNGLLDAGECDRAMHTYERYADKLLAGDSKGFLDSLKASVSKTKDSVAALQITLKLLQKAGGEGHAIREVQELLAHACVQAGDLEKAADLYHELSEAEPENPLHEQNYKQINSRLGKDSVTRELTPEESEQALMVDELEAPPVVVQEYSREIAEAIQSALTDAELFASYNVPEKAVGPLERALPKAPNDVRLRQRLGTLYARLHRFADAANCYRVLAEVHAGAGFGDQAAQFREMAEKYAAQAGSVPASAPPVEPVPTEAPQRKAEMVSADEPIPFRASSVAKAEEPSVAEAAAPAEASVAEFDLTTVPVDSIEEAPAPAPVVAESDQLTEWEDMLTVEAPTAAAEAQPETAGEVHEVAQELPEEIIEEARFYLSQGMVAEAQSAISRLESIASQHPALDELRASALVAKVTEPAIPIQESVEPVAPIEEAPAAEQPAVEFVVEPETEPEPEVPPAVVAPTPPTVAQPAVAASAPAPTVAQPAVPAAAAKHDDGLEVEEIADENPLEDLIPEVAAGEPASFTAPPNKIAPPPPAAAAVAAHATDDPLAGMLSDLEDVLGDLAPPPSAAPKTQPVPAMAASATPQSAVPTVPKPARAPVAAAPPSPELIEAQSMLSDLLDEFKEEVEEPAAEHEDPETHYNLGVAFREMGLLDEAIGELQKVCRAVDNGVPFSQPIQAYTWLAQCLVDKGAPQAAIRWYERALRISGISEDSRLAVFYDMGNALEVAGNKKDALDKFMEVYGSNIDYRDVADRIRSLRA